VPCKRPCTSAGRTNLSVSFILVCALAHREHAALTPTGHPGCVCTCVVHLTLFWCQHLGQPTARTRLLRPTPTVPVDPAIPRGYVTAAALFFCCAGFSGGRRRCDCDPVGRTHRNALSRDRNEALVVLFSASASDRRPAPLLAPSGRAEWAGGAMPLLGYSLGCVRLALASWW